MGFPKYTNSSGKVIGDIINANQMWNPNTEQTDIYITVAIGEIGCITISQFEDITDEQILAYAEYKKECLRCQIEELQEKVKNIDKSLRELRVKN